MIYVKGERRRVSQLDTGSMRVDMNRLSTDAIKLSLDIQPILDYISRRIAPNARSFKKGPVSDVGADVPRRSNESLCADNFFPLILYSTVTDFARLRG